MQIIRMSDRYRSVSAGGNWIWDFGGCVDLSLRGPSTSLPRQQARVVLHRPEACYFCIFDTD